MMWTMTGAPPSSYYLKVDLFNFTQCWQTNWVYETGNIVPIGGPYAVAPATRTAQTVTLGPYSSRFPYLVTSLSSCIGIAVDLNYGTNQGFVATAGTAATLTNAAVPFLPQVVGSTPDTTNITFSTNGTAAARDQTLQEGFSALRSIVQQGQDRANADSRSLGGKLDSIDGKAASIRDNAAGIGTNLATLLDVAKSQTNRPTLNTNTVRSRAASDALGASNAVEGALSGATTTAGQFINAAGSQNGTFSGGGSYWMATIGGESVNLNPLQDASVATAAAFVRGLTLWLMLMSFVAVALSYLFKASGVIAGGVAAGETSLLDMLLEGGGTILSAGAYAGVKAGIVSILVGLISALPVVLLALVATQFGGFTGLLTSPFATSAPMIAQALWLLDAVFPINVFVSGLLWLQAFRLLCTVKLFVGAFIVRMMP